MKRTRFPWTVTLGLAALAAVAVAAPRDSTRIAPPRFDPAAFRVSRPHPYLPLVPGTEHRYVERDRHGTREGTWTVTKDARTVLGVRCVVVHDVLREGTRTIEDTFDWLATDRAGNVWYLGEDTREIREDGRADTEGSWEAGRDGARPGILLPASVRPGPPYREEYLAGEAEDVGQVVAVGDSVTVPFGAFSDCVKIREWSLLERGFEHKWYARGVGMVRSLGSGGSTFELISVTRH